MDMRALGSTGVRVSCLGIGLAALGRPAYITVGHAEDLEGDYDVAAMRARTAEVLDAAWDAGIRYVDAARSYGRAEEFLASWLAGRPADQRPVVGSKWGYEYTGGWRLDADTHEVKEHSEEMFHQQRRQTAMLLGGDLAVYQVHSLTLDSGALDDGALLDALAGLRADGVAVGMSLSGPRQGDTLARALEVERHGVRLFDTVQATWNILEQSAGDVLAQAHAAGVGVIVKEAVANGRLTPRAGEPAVADTIEPIAAAHGVGVDAVAIAAVLAQPWADVVLSGAATVGHLHANLRALDVTLTGGQMQALTALVEDPADYWSRRGALQWT